MNIVQLLEEREQRSTPTRLALENALEEAFLSGRAEQFDNPVPSSVSSTIAIAMACNGHTFATTHGDHTVKVFDFASGKQIRNFKGHPRTPWTLKYHPLNPNIIASGCLGFQVRVWDIEEDACLNIIVYHQTIISLAFHPKGEFIAVACGTRIELWEWQIPIDDVEIDRIKKSHTDTRFLLDGKYSRQYAPQETPRYARGISHKRNIRAVLFHPSGDFVFAVAPEAPKLSNEETAHCRLFSCEFAALFLITAVPKWGEGVVYESGNNRLSSSIVSYQIDRDDGEGGQLNENQDMYILPIKLTSCRILIPYIHLYSDGGIDISKDGRFLLTCARVFVPPLYDELISSNSPNSKKLPPPPGALSPNSHPARVVADEQETARREKKLPPLFVAMNMRHIDVKNSESTPINKNDTPNNYCDVFDALSIEERHHIDGIPAVMNMTSTRTQYTARKPRHPTHVHTGESAACEVVVETLFGASNRAVSAYPRQKLVRIVEKPPSGYTQQDHLCLFEFHFVNGGIVPPTLVNSKNLPGSLTKAITSTKLSATCRHALIGYGVRAGGQVQDHARQHAACEIVDITDEQMSSQAVMIDFEDEVNIAQFHPFPGHGIVYGTKKGKVRTFCKS